METATRWHGGPLEGVAGWLERVRDWLDARGTIAWVAIMVIGFAMFWPLGLAVLIYMIWSKRMSCNGWNRQNRKSWNRRPEATGNAAFDAYRTETLKRLEDERDAFVTFLEQLRAAKDRAEFDQFMTSRQDA